MQQRRAALSEELIINKIRAGDASAADLLLDRYAGPLTRYFEVSMPHAGPGEDFAQEVFLRLLRALRRDPPPQVASLNAFIFTIARNLVLDTRRLAARRPIIESIDAAAEDSAHRSAPVPCQEIPDQALNPREAAAQSEQRRLVREALASLEEPVREILTLRHFEGMTCPQIARLLNLPEGTVWSHLHRGLEALRRQLNPRPISLNSDSVPSADQEAKRRAND